MGAFDQAPKVLTLRRKEFDASGFFIPSPKHLALGGWVKVQLYGGGGNGGSGPTANPGYYGQGGYAGGFMEGTFALTGKIAVTIGAQLAASYFGSLLRAKAGLSGTSFNGYSWNSPIEPGYPELDLLIAPVGVWGGSNPWNYTRGPNGSSTTIPSQCVDGWGQNTKNNQSRGGAPVPFDGVTYYPTPTPTTFFNGKPGYRGSGGGGGGCYYSNSGDPDYITTIVATAGGAGGAGYCLIEWWE